MSISVYFCLKRTSVPSHNESTQALKNQGIYSHGNSNMHITRILAHFYA